MSTPADIRSVAIILTASCNLSCSYCFQNQKTSRRMSWDILRGALDLALGSRRESVEILFAGGEPLLEFERIEMAVAYVAAYRTPTPRVRFSTVTNGTRIDERMAAFLVRHDFETQLSFDGIREAQKLRGEKTYDLLDGLIDRLRSEFPSWYGNRLRINITLSPPTVSHLADSVSYFLEKNVENLTIGALVTHDPNWRVENIRELDRAFSRVFELAKSHYERTGDVPIHEFRKTTPISPDRPTPKTMCGVTRGETLAVDVDGAVHGCYIFSDSFQKFPTDLLTESLRSLRLGTIDDGRLAEQLSTFRERAIATRLFTERESKYSSYGKCGECEYLPVCSVCPMSIGYIPGNADPHRVSDFLCAYNRVVHKYIERFPTQGTDLDVLLGRAPLPREMRELKAAFGDG